MTPSHMGLTYNEVRLLLEARAGGALFDAVATAGRQQLYLHPPELTALADEFGIDRTSEWAAEPFGAYADGFFKQALGTAKLVAMDISDYEGATVVADLNRPIDAGHHERFDAVIDGGTLEHLFDVPVALANYMQMTKVGGRVFISVPANNLCGHGFYQFSPELMYRVFSKAHGFSTHQMRLVEFDYPSVEQRRARAAYDVVDPHAVGERVGLMSRRPAMLLVHAAKLEHRITPFEVKPQQSDYSDRWTAGWRHGQPRRGRARRLLPRAILAKARMFRVKRRFSLSNSRFYRRV